MEDRAASGPRKEHENPEVTHEPGDHTYLVGQVSGVLDPTE